MADRDSSGMGTGTKILIAVLIGCGLCVVVCCGGGYFAVQKVKQGTQLTENPAEISEIQESIASISVPADLTPQNGFSTSLMGVGMKMVAYAREGGGQGEALVLLQMKMPGNISEEDMKQSLRQKMNEQNGNRNVSVDETEIKAIIIDGEEFEFAFTTGTNSETDEEIHMVTGVFPGRDGMAMIMYIESAETWDEAKAIQMLQTISVEGSGPAPPPIGIEEAPTESQTPEGGSTETESEPAETETATSEAATE